MNVTLNGCAMECIVFRDEYAKGGNNPITLHHVNHHAVEAMSLSGHHSLSHIKFIPLAYDSSPSFNIVIRKRTH